MRKENSSVGLSRSTRLAYYVASKLARLYCAHYVHHAQPRRAWGLLWEPSHVGSAARHRKATFTTSFFVIQN